MRNILSITVLVYTLFQLAGCAKNNPCQPKTVQSEDAAMQALAATNGMTATQHSSGMYYEIISPGAGAIPNPYSSVSVRYVGKLPDGTIFDQATDPTPLFPVNNFIHGWQLGLQLIKEGGYIKLIIPSSLAYGCSGAGTIPPHSILYFEIQLVDVQ